MRRRSLRQYTGINSKALWSLLGAFVFLLASCKVEGPTTQVASQSSSSEQQEGPSSPTPPQAQVSTQAPATASATASDPETSLDRKRARAFLGISFRAETKLEIKGTDTPLKAVEILRVVPGTAAQRAGLKIGDLILEYDSNHFNDTPDDKINETFRNYIREDKKIGDPFHLKLFRSELTVSGLRGQEPFAPEPFDEDTLSEWIQTQKIDETLELKIHKKPINLEVTARLGQWLHRRTTPPPSNAELFPEYENYSDTWLDVSNALIQHFDIIEPYNDLMERYSDDEWWDDGHKLKHFRYVHRDPFKLPKMADDITQRFLNSVAGASGSPSSSEASTASISSNSPKNFRQVITHMASLLDVPMSGYPPHISVPPQSRNVEDHIRYILEVVQAARVWREKAFFDFSAKEMEFLYAQIPAIVEKFADHYYLDVNTTSEVFAEYEEAIQMAQRVDYGALLASSRALSQLTQERWLQSLEAALRQHEWKPEDNQHPGGTNGEILLARETELGWIVIGGEDWTQYEKDFAIVIDLGGDDFYTNNSGAARNAEIPVAVVIDLAGDDHYSSTIPVSQGSGLLGTGLLIDRQGNDVYTGTQAAQGVGVMGIGLLIDFAGRDRYDGQEINQGFGIWGSGLLADLGGDDLYNSHYFAQGVGAPKGLGLLLDTTGDDEYYATGLRASTYSVPGIFKGSSQGFGIGFREYASGGIGILLDAQGKDHFRAGNFSQGGGYFFGLGILKNGGSENDIYFGSRYAQGFSAHSAAGILLDDGGNDRYVGRVGAFQAAAWDLGSAMLIDKGGDDVYDPSGKSFAQGAAANNGFSLFWDLGGSDTYLLNPAPITKANANNYHGGYSLSIFLDNGGETDHYPPAQDFNNQIAADGEWALFLDLDKDIRHGWSLQSLERLIR